MERFVEKILLRLLQVFQVKLKKDFDKDASRFTVSRRLNDFGLKACSPSTKPLISKKKKTARIIYAETHILWSE